MAGTAQFKVSLDATWTGLLPDHEISRLAKAGMIEPFDSGGNNGVVSSGLTSYGYDFRLSAKDIYTSHLGRADQGVMIDPADSNSVRRVMAKNYPVDNYVIIPPRGFLLGVSLEAFKLPEDIMALCIGKSTYARCGIDLLVTPLEPGWAGHLTIEITNTNPFAEVKIYVNAGIGQLIFFRGMPCDNPYNKKAGAKYQDQPERVVFPNETPKAFDPFS